VEAAQKDFEIFTYAHSSWGGYMNEVYSNIGADEEIDEDILLCALWGEVRETSQHSGVEVAITGFQGVDAAGRQPYSKRQLYLTIARSCPARFSNDAKGNLCQTCDPAELLCNKCEQFEFNNAYFTKSGLWKFNFENHLTPQLQLTTNYAWTNNDWFWQYLAHFEVQAASLIAQTMELGFSVYVDFVRMTLGLVWK